MYDVPIVFLVFNRPEHTSRTLSVIRSIRPRQLRVVADGPREHVPEDVANCRAVRDLIDNGVDWDCELQRDFSDVNLGCSRRVASGITNAFVDFDRAVILEDDLLPNRSFFRFCDEMLDRYADDTRISSITGNNFQRGIRRSSNTYYFSKYPHCWGWATWRRAWEKFDYEMSLPAATSDADIVKKYACTAREVSYWESRFAATRSGEIDTWDFRWLHACWKHSMLTILPEQNLVSNFGNGPTATHTKGGIHVPTQELAGVIKHPTRVEHNSVADTYTFDTVFRPRLRYRIIRKLSQLGRKIVSSSTAAN